MQVGENRIVSLDREPGSESGAALIMQDDGTFRHERLWRGSAVALPVFALRSKDSVGAGEFSDLKKLVTLCHLAGKSLVLSFCSILLPKVRDLDSQGCLL